MAYTRVNWEDGELSSAGYVTIDGIQHTVTEATYTGTTPMNATNLNVMDKGIYDLYNALFPVGQIIIRGDNADYSNWLGYTWERTAVGKVLVGYDSSDTDFDTIGETGGEKTHTLSINEMPSHNHGMVWNGGSRSGESAIDWLSASATQLVNTQYAGGGQAHNNLQPYQVVAYWKRIA